LNSGSCIFPQDKGIELGTESKPLLIDMNPTLPLAAGTIAVLYVFNPIVNYSDKKMNAGVTKEFSVGFGYFGEHRLGVEYTYNFKSDMRNSLRVGYKYDILLKSGLSPSNMLQGTSVVSLGAGYFTDFKSHGYFPEVAYGYSIRNDKFLFFPHVKLRYTFIPGAEKPDIADLSFGIILGIANPFIDLKIRSRH